jgi:hypothetical protein
MKIERIGFMTPGDMGQGVAMQLKKKGFTVCTALDKRSERSRKMAAEAGLTDVGSIARLVAEADLVMSVMNPGAALEFAREAAEAIRAQAHKPVFIDCNAVAPDTMREIDAALRAAGSRCLDGGLIGPPPRGNAKVNLYVSGPGASDLAQIGNEQLKVHVMNERLGDASAIKMCYILKAFPQLPPKAYRWVPEMHEIARTFAGVGMTPRIFQGEADMFELVAQTALGQETPENRDRSRTGKDVIVQLAASPRSK